MGGYKGTVWGKKQCTGAAGQELMIRWDHCKEQRRVIHTHCKDNFAKAEDCEDDDTILGQNDHKRKSARRVAFKCKSAVRLCGKGDQGWIQDVSEESVPEGPNREAINKERRKIRRNEARTLLRARERLRERFTPTDVEAINKK